MSAEPVARAAGPVDRTALRVAIAVLVGSFPSVLGTTTVSVGLHELSRDLGVGVDEVSWVTTAYLLAICVAVPVVGWLQSVVGGRRLWLLALGLFMVGSVLCALAWSAGSLICARVAQGLGAGVMMPLLTTLLIQATPVADRARVTSVVALTTALGPVLGPVVGGLVLGVADWRWLFWINLPLGLAGMVVAWWLIPRDRPEGRGRLDVVGLCLLPPALFGLVWGLTNVAASDEERVGRVGVPILVGAVLLSAFVGWARRRGGAALVDVRVLRSRPTWAATVVLFLSGAVVHGAMLLLPLSWQELRGTDALGAGLLLIPQGVGALLSRVVALRLLAARGPRTVAVVGFTLTAVATAPFALLGTGAGAVLLGVVLLVRGLGVGMVVVPLMAVAFDGLDHDEVPHASIVIRVGQQLGGSFGVALLAVVVTAGTAAGGSASAGFTLAFWGATAIAVLAVIASVALPGRPAVRPAGAGREAVSPG